MGTRTVGNVSVKEETFFMPCLAMPVGCFRFFWFKMNIKCRRMAAISPGHVSFPISVGRDICSKFVSSV